MALDLNNFYHTVLFCGVGRKISDITMCQETIPRLEPYGSAGTPKRKVQYLGKDHGFIKDSDTTFLAKRFQHWQGNQLFLSEHLVMPVPTVAFFEILN